MQKIKLVIAALAAITLSAPAMAAMGNNECSTSPLASWMSGDVVVKKAQAAGIKVENVYVVGSYFEVHASNKKGQRLLAYIDPVKGAIVHTRPGSSETRARPICLKTMLQPKLWLGADRIYDKAQGMNMDVRGIRVVGSYYEVHAVDAGNRRILAYFSPLNAKLIATRAYSRPGKAANTVVRDMGMS